jgi:hypothetical protein
MQHLIGGLNSISASAEGSVPRRRLQCQRLQHRRPPRIELIDDRRLGSALRAALNATLTLLKVVGRADQRLVYGSDRC